jgi:cytochrome oxidase Cu insertion factor (SCO1/SenC/PrrC family)
MALKLLRVAILIATLALAACAAPTAGGVTPGTGVAANDAPASGPGADSSQVGIDVGQRAPAFSVTGLDGRQVSDVDLRAQGKPYILYFYATW